VQHLCASLAPRPPGAALSGAWIRAGRSLGGQPVEEPSLVVWLQAGSRFADLRWPLPGAGPLHALDVAQAFSGSVSLHGTVATWCHDLDTSDRAPGHVDSAVVGRDGDLLVEQGQGYVEHWRLASGAGDDAVAAELVVPTGDRRFTRTATRVAARAVRVGALAVGVWSDPFPGGCLYELDPEGGGAGTTGAGWSPTRRLGHPDGGVGVPVVLAALDAGRPPASPWRLAASAFN